MSLLFASRPVHLFTLISDLPHYRIYQHNIYKIKLDM